MKTIELKKVDAIAFFGSVENITELLKIKQPSIAQWFECVPEKSAWALYYISKKPKWRRNKLAVTINV